MTLDSCTCTRVRSRAAADRGAIQERPRVAARRVVEVYPGAALLRGQLLRAARAAVQGDAVRVFDERILHRSASGLRTRGPRAVKRIGSGSRVDEYARIYIGRIKVLEGQLRQHRRKLVAEHLELLDFRPLGE